MESQIPTIEMGDPLGRFYFVTVCPFIHWDLSIIFFGLPREYPK